MSFPSLPQYVSPRSQREEISPWVPMRCITSSVAPKNATGANNNATDDISPILDFRAASPFARDGAEGFVEFAASLSAVTPSPPRMGHLLLRPRGEVDRDREREQNTESGGVDSLQRLVLPSILSFEDGDDIAEANVKHIHMFERLVVATTNDAVGTGEQRTMASRSRFGNGRVRLACRACFLNGELGTGAVTHPSSIDTIYRKAGELTKHIDGCKLISEEDRMEYTRLKGKRKAGTKEHLPVAARKKGYTDIGGNAGITFEALA